MARSRTQDRSPVGVNVRLERRKALRRLTEQEPQASVSTAPCLGFPICKTATPKVPHF